MIELEELPKAKWAGSTGTTEEADSKESKLSETFSENSIQTL